MFFRVQQCIMHPHAIGGERIALNMSGCHGRTELLEGPEFAMWHRPESTELLCESQFWPPFFSLWDGLLILSPPVS